jgi:hypothetical protein
MLRPCPKPRIQTTPAASAILSASWRAALAGFGHFELADILFALFFRYLLHPRAANEHPQLDELPAATGRPFLPITPAASSRRPPDGLLW